MKMHRLFLSSASSWKAYHSCLPSKRLTPITFISNLTHLSAPQNDRTFYEHAQSPCGDPHSNACYSNQNGIGLVYLDSIPQNSYPHDREVDEFKSDVEKLYRILRKFHSRVPKLELALQESGVVMRAGLAERVLGRCGDAGNLAYMFFVWASKQPGYRHSYDVNKSMVKILGKMRQFGAVWALIEEMRKGSPHLITSDVFVVLMRRFASARMVKKAVEVLDEMPKYGCEPDEHVFGCLLGARMGVRKRQHPCLKI